jgi:hypothetical protein
MSMGLGIMMINTVFNTELTDDGEWIFFFWLGGYLILVLGYFPQRRVRQSGVLACGVV